MIKAAIIGFGGIAKAAHFPAYLQLEKEGLVKLVAVCDGSPDAFDGDAEINIGSSSVTLDESVHKYTDYREMLDKEELDMVDICVPTFLHPEITVYALKTGHHVLCEKPMSPSYELCLDMINASKESGKRLMIGQCLRFSKLYGFLKDAVENNTFGSVKNGIFTRTSAPPMWSWENWYMDYDKSHGCIADMHIHDIDIARCIFGEPDAVSSNTCDIYSKKDIAHTTLTYKNFTILAIGDWSRDGTQFAAGYNFAFEKATVICSDGKITVYPRGGEPYSPDLGDEDFYFNEIKFFAESIENGTVNHINPPEASALTIKLVEKLIESSDKNGICILNDERKTV